MDSWLAERGFTSKRLRWLVKYGCRDDFGGSLGQTSAWAGLHYHAARLPGEDRDEEAAEFLTWPEGNGRLVDHLAKSATRRIVTGALVFDLIPRTARGGPVSLRYLDAAKDEVVAVEARDAVAAIPKYALARVLAPWRAAPPAFLSGLDYAPWLVANVTLSGRPKERGFPMAWDNVLYDSPSLGYVVATHQTGPASGRDDGPTVWTWYHAYAGEETKAARQKLYGATWDELASAVLADLCRARRTPL